MMPQERIVPHDELELPAQPTFARNMDDVVPEIERMAGFWLARDENLGAFYADIVGRVHSKDGFYQLVGHCLETRMLSDKPDRQVTAQTYVNIVQRAMHMLILEDGRKHYGDKMYKDPSAWHERIDHMLQDPIQREKLQYALVTRTIQSTLFERYLIPKVIMLSERERIGLDPSVLDIGTSSMQGPLWMLSGKAAQRVKVRYGITENEEIAVNDPLTKYFNTYAARRLRPQIAVGLDKVDLDEANREWEFACTFRPGELSNKKRVKQWLDLRPSKVKNAVFKQGSFEDSEEPELREFLSSLEPPVVEPKVIIMATMTYLLSKKELEQKRQMARRMVSKDGLIIYVDFAMPHPENRSQFYFFPQWNDGTYRTMVEYPEDETHTLNEVAISDGGRCNDIQFGPDIGKLAIGKTLAQRLSLSPEELREELIKQEKIRRLGALALK